MRYGDNCCESEQSGMECAQQDYVVSFLVVSILVLRGNEREGKEKKGETADRIRLIRANIHIDVEIVTSAYIMVVQGIGLFCLVR